MKTIPRWWWAGAYTPRVHVAWFRFSWGFDPRNCWMLGWRLHRSRRVVSPDVWLLTIGIGPFLMLASKQRKDQ